MGKKNFCVCSANNFEFSDQTFFGVPSKEKIGSLIEILKKFVSVNLILNVIELLWVNFVAICSLKDDSVKKLDKILESYAQKSSPSFKPRTKVTNFNDIISECEIFVKIHSNSTLKVVLYKDKHTV